MIEVNILTIGETGIAMMGQVIPWLLPNSMTSMTLASIAMTKTNEVAMGILRCHILFGLVRHLREDTAV